MISTEESRGKIRASLNRMGNYGEKFFHLLGYFLAGGKSYYQQR
jgi:hypothetical protein